MKNLFVIIIVAMGITTLNAQQETVFGKFKNWGAFGSANFEYGVKNSQFSSAAGGGFGLVIGPVFIGGYGIGSGDLDKLNRNKPSLDLAHGGLWLGYTPMSAKVFHPIFSLKLGTGAVDIELDGRGHREDLVSVITPEIGVELNITKIFRLAVTGNYRFVSGVEESNVRSNKDFEGFNIGVGLRIGWFGSWKNKSHDKKSRVRINISDNENDNDIDNENDNDTENDNDNDNDNNDNDSENGIEKGNQEKSTKEDK